MSSLPCVRLPNASAREDFSDQLAWQGKSKMVHGRILVQDRHLVTAVRHEFCYLQYFYLRLRVFLASIHTSPLAFLSDRHHMSQ